MSRKNRQLFVAYGCPSDEFDIVFYGGPLDGARVRTDVFPDSKTFTHRVGQRNYTYRYTQISSSRFHAHLNSFEGG
ncbi:MAG: hypothetical protein P8N76_09530 [Pirellulaceae bacterium]|nr:hypothetical protein [Planctomycetaceae bacterium]MDG2381905.1 hypothetical protein [Pirellulaceae bacterium]